MAKKQMEVIAEKVGEEIVETFPGVDEVEATVIKAEHTPATESGPWLSRIQEANVETGRLCVEWEAAKTAAKEAKELYDSSVVHLTRLIEESRTGQMELFGDNKPAGSDAWHGDAIESLLLPDNVCEYVKSAGFHTIGKLSDLMAGAGDFWDHDVTVGGQRKPQRFRSSVEDAFTAFWASHPEFCK